MFLEKVDSFKNETLLKIGTSLFVYKMTVIFDFECRIFTRTNLTVKSKVRKHLIERITFRSITFSNVPSETSKLTLKIFKSSN